MEDYRLHWLAGFWDGEGTISIARRSTYYIPFCSVVNTDKDVIDYICDILNDYEIEYRVDYREFREELNCKPSWTIRLESRPRVMSLLSILAQYLVGKRKQAELVTEWCLLPRFRGADNRSDRYWEIIDNLKDLNSIGNSKRVR